MAYKLKRHKIKLLWNSFLLVLRIFLPFISYFFFGQIFSFLTSVFYCRKEESYESPYLQCLEGLWIYSLSPVAIIAMIFQLIIGFITNSLYYRPLFNNNIPDNIKKTNPFPDIILMLTKSIISLLFISDKGLESEHWAMLSFLILVTGINAYCTLSFQNRKNALLMSINNIFSLITFLSFVTLFFGKIMEAFEFNGLIFVFIFDIIIILVYRFFYKINEINIVNVNFKNINNSSEYLNYIYKYYMIIKRSKNERSYSGLLRILVSKMEEKCYNPDCPLNKYLKNLNKGIECNYYLFQYCEYIFQYGISKFNKDNELKHNYSLFLIIEMNNKKKALMILNSIKNQYISLQMNYNIFRSKKLIGNFNIKNNNENFLVAKYNNDFHRLKYLISKITLLLYEFYSLILANKVKKDDNFKRIFKLGSEIITFNKIIKKIFDELIKVKINNIELIDLYTEFIETILEDEEQYQKCQDIKKIIYNNSENILENNFSNFDINVMKEKYNLPFLILSGDLNNVGIIKDCSLSISKIFDYQKKELIGENINILIPDIFHNQHNLIITQQIKKDRSKLFEKIFDNTIYLPDFLEIEGYGISKSKFLIPIKLNIYFIKTEEGELVYIVEIYKRIQKINENNNNDLKCCVLTDTNFLIQSFTLNCIYHLNLNYNHINGNYEIINNIKQFQEDYLIDINMSHLSKNTSIKESSLMTNKKIKKAFIASTFVKSIKTDILNKNYSKKCKITWIIDKNDNNNNSKNESKSFMKSKSSINHYDIFGKGIQTKNGDEKEMYMEIKKIIMNKELIGYYFYFSGLNNNKINANKLYHNEENFKKLIDQSFSRNGNNLNMLRQTTEKINPPISSKRINEYKNNKNNKNRKKSWDKLDKKIFLIKEEYKSYYKEEKKLLSGNYISKSKCNFLFDPVKLTYIFSNKSDDGKLINEILKKEADTKIKIYQFQKNSLIYRKQNLSVSYNKSNISEEEEEEDNSLLFSNNSSESESSSKSNKSINNKLYIGTEENVQNDNKNQIKIEKEKIIKNIDNKYMEQKNIREIKKKNDFNDYYKIDTSKIKFLIFDFYKEIFIEGDQNEKISKVEVILSNIKNNFSSINKEQYPYIILQNNKMKKKIEKKENKKQKDIIINEEKLLKKKIILSLNNKEDDNSIKKMKLYSLIYFIIMIILLCICIYYYLNSYSKIKGLLKLVKNAIYIKYCDRLSVFYIGESTLLNFNASKIEGGIFYNFPANPNNKKGYISLMREKIKESFLENELSLQELLSSQLELTKNTTKYLNETILNTDYIINSGKIENISADIFTTLMQYNGAFYNLASSQYYLEQNHSDILNFLHNSFNDYEKGINILIKLYCYELELQIKYIKLIWILGLIVFFIIYIIIYIIIVINLISTSKKRASYIEILYGIDEIILKELIVNCEKLQKKMNKIKINDREDLIEEKNSFIKQQPNLRRKSIFIDRDIVPPKDLYLKKKLPKNILGFMKNFGFFLLISFVYYIFNSFYFINLGENAILLSQYFYRTQNVHTNLIDLFIAYI